MRRPAKATPARQPKVRRQVIPGTWRDRVAVLLALVTVSCVGWAFFLAKDTQFLMPGPLVSAHATIENCNACHTRSGSGKLSWVHGLVAGDPIADSNACLTCHKMPDTALYAHGASADVLAQSTKRLSKLASGTPMPQSARAQSIAFPADGKVANGIFCATCHQEHQGANFNLNKITNEQCRSCHVVKFDSFDGHHPEFVNYPFKQRTRIVYDHAGHFGKHFPEVAKKEPAKRIPATCSTCHNSHEDRRVMAVAPFEQTCAACHLGQIVGKERVSGPKGIAFLSLPGLDLKTLKKKKAAIGEWPAESEAELTPFMKVMISRNAQGRALIKSVDRLNLQDLSRANTAQILAVTNLAWEIKRLFYALIMGKASDVLADFDIGDKAKLSANLVADLTASIPRDVVVSAQQQWLPNLGTEMASRPGAPGAAKPSPPAQADRQPPAKSAPEVPTAAAVQPEAAPRKNETADEPPRARAADQTDDLLNPTPEELRGGARGPAVKGYTAYGPYGGSEAHAANQPARTVNAATKGAVKVAQAKTPDQTDDLLFPDGGAPDAAGRENSPGTANSPSPAPPRASPADAASPTVPGRAAEPQTEAAPAVSIQSDVDPENWAEYGGWYRQDYAIFYRPVGHKDKFIYSWLFLTGPHAPKGDRGPAAAVFDFLIGKDAQGSCTKCHSVDDNAGKGRVVNFSPPSVRTKQGRFTSFVHEPHFGVMENRGCLTCHKLEKGRPYLKSYEQGNPLNFISNFGAVKKELCQTCHTSNLARQDCLLCHKYHVHGVVTPIINTKIPIE